MFIFIWMFLWPACAWAAASPPPARRARAHSVSALSISFLKKNKNQFPDFSHGHGPKSVHTEIILSELFFFPALCLDTGSCSWSVHPGKIWWHDVFNNFFTKTPSRWAGLWYIRPPITTFIHQDILRSNEIIKIVQTSSNKDVGLVSQCAVAEHALGGNCGFMPWNVMSCMQTKTNTIIQGVGWQTIKLNCVIKTWISNI